MQPDIFREIVEAIVREQLLLNWRFYLLICGFTFLATAAGHWLSSYLKKRGETLATKADMHEILRQLSETTRVTEQVRSAVSQADWAAREWRTTRRVKLEELLSTAYLLDKWLDLQRSKWLHAEAVTADDAPMERLKLLAALYFPELRVEATSVWLSHQKALLFILEISSRTRAALQAGDVTAHKNALNEFTEGWKPFYESSSSAISALENRASALMAEVAVAQLGS